MGNICMECEHRLLNYHKLDEQKDLEVDSGREETPVIVDDDDLLYNLFFDANNDERNTQSSTAQENIVVIDLSDASASDAETKPPATETVNKKRKRHITYDEKQLILLAKLNLVSSDSEEDEIFTSPCAPASTPVTGITELLRCCICASVFSDNLELLHHLRSRHRTNEHDTQLRERMRHAQDSALTIRLCFKGRFMYYECQMCGRIDGVFKDHKEHVIAEHSAELISLKDPLLKRLQCPVCHESCGSMYIEVCRHLLQTHSIAQYKFFINEIISHTDAVADADVKSVALTAQVYRFQLRPNLYFSCRHCKELHSSVKSHRKHLKDKHQIITSSDRSQIATSTTTLQLRNLRVKKKQPQQQQQQQKEEQHVKLEQSLEKKKVGRPKKNFNLKTPPKEKPQKLVKTSVKKGVSNRRVAAAEHNLHRVRVKVKQPIKQIPLQTYDCQYCKKHFQGFIPWNLHNLEEHIEQEDCMIDKKLLTSYKHKRANRRKALSLNVDENSNNVEKQKKVCRNEKKEVNVNDNDINLNSNNSGCCIKFRPNTAILKETPNVKSLKWFDSN